MSIIRRRCRICAAVILIGMFISQIAAGQERTNRQSDSDAKKKERAQYANELEKLKQEDPVRYAQDKKRMTIALQMFLGAAGYRIGPFDGIMGDKTASALRQYQKDRGLPINGDVLDMDLRDKLAEDEALLRPPMEFPPAVLGIFDRWDEGFVLVRGTWALLNDKIGNPIQTSEITCIKSLGQCIEAKAEVNSSFNFLSVSTQFLDIERWDKSEIVTKPLDSICRRSITRINRLQKSVTGIDSKISDEGFCKVVPDRDINSELQDGFPIYWKLWLDYKEKRNSILKLTPDAVKLMGSDAEKK